MDTKFTPKTPEELAAIAGNIRVADPSVDNGAFSSVRKMDAYLWLKMLGITSISAEQMSTDDDEKARRKLRAALWDVQRVDNIFTGSSLSGSPLPVNNLTTWKDWRRPHQELFEQSAAGSQTVDVRKEEDALKSHVHTHFSMSAFTQEEILKGIYNTSPDDWWTSVRAAMLRAATDITAKDLENTRSPFVSFSSASQEDPAMLMMEVLDVKECPWPEPTGKFLEQLKNSQHLKYGIDPSEPLSLVYQSPTFPMIIVRYSYLEGRPKNGSRLVSHLQQQLEDSMPDSSSAEVTSAFHEKLVKAVELNPQHLRMFARLLSFNSELLGSEYIQETQSHWKGISLELSEESQIGFFVPCLRLRWRAKEEIERGLTPIKILGQTCKKCGKKAQKFMCTSCKSVHYCGKECITADWPNHKAVCKLSKKLFANPSSFNEKGKYLVSARTYAPFMHEWGFSLQQEANKYSGTNHVGELSRNEYGEEPFLVSVALLRSYSVGGRFHGQTAMIWDRRRSIALRSGHGDPVVMKERGGGFEIPSHASGHQDLVALVRSKGILDHELIYLWARRIGDCIELDLVDYPDPNSVDWR